MVKPEVRDDQVYASAMSFRWQAVRLRREEKEGRRMTESRQRLGATMAAFALVLLAASATAQAAAKKPAPAAVKEKLFTLTSPAFKDDAMLPVKFTGANTCGAGSKGKNISPPLAWSNAPPSTKSFALMMIDPDGRRGIGSVHWIAYNIPASRHGLKEGEGSAEAKDITGGKNSRGTTLYTGPCGPHQDAPHHYVIQLIALDVAPGFLQPGLTHDELLNMINGHGLAPASLVVRYRRQ
jgi:Raf kinase inhibitor-like YbhB/YbcL family protein